jgi:DNA-binding transcriptional regulator YiaG
MTEQEKGIDIQHDARICPECGAARVETEWGTDRFMYGDGPTAVELFAEVPFRKCANCGFEFTDSEAEEARNAAIRKHLKVLLPAEIAGIRHSYEMTRAEFAARTRIGPASLARWENGQLIHNAAYDNYLYLLRFRENMDRLDQRFADTAQQLEVAAATLVLVGYPRCRQLTDVRKYVSRESTFALRKPMQKAG